MERLHFDSISTTLIIAHNSDVGVFVLEYIAKSSQPVWTNQNDFYQQVMWKRMCSDKFGVELLGLGQF